MLFEFVKMKYVYLIMYIVGLVKGKLEYFSEGF